MLLVSCTFVVHAQESKSITVSQPKQGDIAFGIDLMPFINFAGNVANANTSNTITEVGGSAWTDNYNDDTSTTSILSPDISIMAKYMLTSEIAVKLNVGFTSSNNESNTYSDDFMALVENPLSEAKVIDTKTTSSSIVAISLGGEYRIGKRRLVGVVGANLLYAKEKTFTTYQMGNELNEINQAPTSGTFVNEDFVDTKYDVDYFTATYLSEKYGDGFAKHYGIGLDFGVEYMLSSQIALGGSVSMYGLRSISPNQYVETVGYNTNTGSVEYHTELTAPKSKTTTYGTSNMGAKLYMMFYF